MHVRYIPQQSCSGALGPALNGTDAVWTNVHMPQMKVTSTLNEIGGCHHVQDNVTPAPTGRCCWLHAAYTAEPD
jgi:hypothetical protein